MFAANKLRKNGNLDTEREKFEPRIATLGGLETGDFAEHLRSTGLGVKRNSHNLASLKSFDVTFK